MLFSLSLKMMSSATKQRDALEQPLSWPACFTQPYVCVRTCTHSYICPATEMERGDYYFFWSSFLSGMSEPLSVAALRTGRFVETAALLRPKVSGMSCVRQLMSSASRSRDVPPSPRTSSSAETKQWDALPFTGTHQKLLHANKTAASRA